MPIPSLRGGQLKVLTRDQMEKINTAVLDLMQTVGVRVEHPKALAIYRDAGCQVDFDQRVVKVPADVLQRALRTAPREFTLHGKSEEFDVHVTLDDVYTIGGSSALSVLDLEGGRHPATLRDLVDFTRLLDAMEHLHIMHAIVNPQDIPQPGFDRILFATVMKHTGRNYYSQGQWGVSIRDQVAMAAVVQGGTEQVRRKPCFTVVLCMMSPLINTGERVDELLACCEHNIPIYIEVDPMMGSTAPITVAGALVEECANVLTGVTLAQIVNPGHPCIFAIASGLSNPATGDYSGGAPETNLLHAATAQMSHYYGLPFQGGTGIEPCVPDAQAGYERALQVLTNALAGTNFIHLSLGMMEQMLLAAYEQVVIDNEIIGSAFRIVRGVEVDDELIGLDTIKEVGIGGNYLDAEHTVRHLRSQVWIPQIANRDRYETWMAAGGKDLRQRANDRARQILQDHHPKPLTDDQEAEIDRLAKDAQQRAVGAGTYSMV
ncbi:trimethylamine methyltransferase family protein [bacterium]|nr:trimethylamine methyltransferase family protein [bacterium]